MCLVVGLRDLICSPFGEEGSGGLLNLHEATRGTLLRLGRSEKYYGRKTERFRGDAAGADLGTHRRGPRRGGTNPTSSFQGEKTCNSL